MERFPRLAPSLSAAWVAGLLAFAATVPAVAQEAAVISLRSNTPDALVYADSLYLGRAQTQWFVVPRETTRLRLVYPSGDNWSMTPAHVSVNLLTVDTLDVTLDFMFHYAITSDPFDANVLLETPAGRSLLGTTPLLHTAPAPLMGVLLLQKDGYELKRLTPGDRIWNRHDETLQPAAPDLALDAVDELVRRPRGRWLNVALGGAAVASGVLAVHYKMKADSRYELYAVDGDPRLRGSFQRYDRSAAVALGAMQVGIGVLAIRLVRQ
ncbi:MAG: hypothetical protein SH809_07160 [Rhodothermales bacterium]|nr:hypothetical protein [Rhodothermales bacterium]